MTARVKGTVSKIMDFGAFVRLESGVEGLVHISELSHKRVFRVSDVVQEGQEIEAKVLSVDPEAQRMSLSMKALEARAEPQIAADESRRRRKPTPAKMPTKRTVPLKGGLGRSEPRRPAVRAAAGEAKVRTKTNYEGRSIETASTARFVLRTFVASSLELVLQPQVESLDPESLPTKSNAGNGVALSGSVICRGSTRRIDLVAPAARHRCK